MISEYTKRILKGLTLKQKRAMFRLIDEISAIECDQWQELAISESESFWGSQAQR